MGILGLESKLPAQYDARAKWLFNKATKNVIAGLVDTTGRALWNQEQQYPNFAAGYPPTLLGKPVMVSEFMPDIAANAYPILFGDFSGYFIVDRVGLSVEVYRETYADMDKVLIYMRKRVGGDALYPWQIKAMKVAATV